MSDYTIEREGADNAEHLTHHDLLYKRYVFNALLREAFSCSNRRYKRLEEEKIQI